jgi:CubicO group peptidase (beta-lactamase class C family)
MQVIEVIAKGMCNFEPNDEKAYSCSNIILSSYIIKKVYRKPYSTTLKAKILKPLVLEETYYGK